MRGQRNSFTALRMSHEEGGIVWPARGPEQDSRTRRFEGAQSLLPRSRTSLTFQGWAHPGNLVGQDGGTSDPATKGATPRTTPPTLRGGRLSTLDTVSRDEIIKN